MTIPEENGPCPNCSAQAGERHSPYDDIARCYYTGIQFIQCGWHPDDEDEISDLDKEEYYKAHPTGECEPSIWDGEWPGTKQCRELGWYTKPDSIWGYMEDLNALAYASHFGSWDVENQKWIIPDHAKKAGEKYRKMYS